MNPAVLENVIYTKEDLTMEDKKVLMSLRNINMVFKRPGSLTSDRYIHVLKDVSLDELENDDALMYNKDTEKWENTDLEKPVGESVNKYLNEAVIDGGSAPTP